jgi:hypothetical protein
LNDVSNGLIGKYPTYHHDSESSAARYGPLQAIAWYEKNCSDWKSILFSATQVKPVGSKGPSGLGFYGMLGNVWELCRPEGEHVETMTEIRFMFRADPSVIVSDDEKRKPQHLFTIP